jgi:hypothetical protein
MTAPAVRYLWAYPRHVLGPHIRRSACPAPRADPACAENRPVKLGQRFRLATYRARLFIQRDDDGSAPLPYSGLESGHADRVDLQLACDPGPQFAERGFGQVGAVHLMEYSDKP